MIVTDFFFSLLIAAILSVFIAMLIHRRGARKGFFWFFLTLFLATWAGGTWGNKLSHVFAGISWLPYLLASLLTALLLLIFMPKTPKIGRRTQLNRIETQEMLEQIGKTREIKKLAYVTIDFFLGLILLLLVAAIILRYFKQG